jgi:hypothetical protein
VKCRAVRIPGRKRSMLPCSSKCNFYFVCFLEFIEQNLNFIVILEPYILVNVGTNQTLEACLKTSERVQTTKRYEITTRPFTARKTWC